MTDTPLRSFILFQIAGSTYAVPSDSVDQVEMVEHVTPLPGAAPFVDGVVFTRGQVIPAINLRARFGYEKLPYNVRTRLVVVNPSGRKVGLVVDEAREFVNISASAIKPPHEMIRDTHDRYLEGIATIGERIVLLLDVAGIVGHDALEQLTEGG